MNYGRHYEALIERARHREVAGYVERHHVVPKCMGGTDDPENIVPLTPEEHFVAHQLLMKIYPGNRRLVFAAWAMVCGRPCNKRYGWLKRKQSEAQTGARLSEEARKKISAKAKGRKLTKEAAEALKLTRLGKKNTEEHNARVSSSLKGKPKSDEHKNSIKRSRENLQYTPELRAKLAANKGRKLSEKQRKALLDSIAGKPLSNEHKKKISAANAGRVRALVECPHCGKVGGDGIMKRWHFDKCKVKHA